MAFLDQFGAEAHQLGRTQQQLFGIHPEHGFLRVEYAGAVIVNDRPVIAVEPARIGFDRFSSYRTKPRAGLGAVGRGIRSPRPLMSRVAYWLGSYVSEIAHSLAPRAETGQGKWS
ncbi:hypothetical protein [Methylobacterium sp. B1]|uniref:hypothetical protein n=1 Tax=Methylobacterium sp. B1 TaxID=91459 RepID=UPI0020741832|nr:hypothetical protein [Methylobacterium sp. B1]